MKKKILSVMFVMTLLIGTCSVAVAADTKGTATRNYLKSYGSIEYHNGTDKVVINSDDLYILADQIDQIKLYVTSQLEAINTFFTAGDGISLSTDDNISITHSQPSENDTVDPLSVDFDALLEGIASSQSISTDVTDYGYSPGTKLYQRANGSLTTDGSEESATEIEITAATAPNLSAGTAAWVNGELILGTGEDNKSYMESGSITSETGTVDAAFVKSGTNLLKIWPNLFDYNIKVYIVCNSGYVYGGFTAGNHYNDRSASGTLSASYTINKTTGVITITNKGYLDDSGSLRVEGKITVSGAVVILSQKN